MVVDRVVRGHRREHHGGGGGEGDCRVGSRQDERGHRGDGVVEGKKEVIEERVVGRKNERS